MKVVSLIPHERGCMDAMSGDVYPTVSTVKDEADHVEFFLVA